MRVSGCHSGLPLAMLSLKSCTPLSVSTLTLRVPCRSIYNWTVCIALALLTFLPRKPGRMLYELLKRTSHLVQRRAGRIK